MKIRSWMAKERFALATALEASMKVLGSGETTRLNTKLKSY